MGALKGRGLPRRLQGGGGRRLASAPDPGSKPGPRREADRATWRAWYKTARWQKLRLRVIERDGRICAATGALLSGKHPAANSPVVDHIEAHRGDAALFWDESNLQVVSKAYHDGEKQRQERFGLG